MADILEHFLSPVGAELVLTVVLVVLDVLLVGEGLLELELLLHFLLFVRQDRVLTRGTLRIVNGVVCHCVHLVLLR